MIAILHNIRSLHNVGSMFRTADAAGIEKLYLCGITPSPLNKYGFDNQQLTKTALGAEKIVPWEKIPLPMNNRNRGNLSAEVPSSGTKEDRSYSNYKINSKSLPIGPTLKLIEMLKSQNYKIYAIEQAKNSIPYFKSRLTKKELAKTALVVGSEVTGLPTSILKLSDKIIEIPMHGQKESLNVSVAFGIISYSLLTSQTKHTPNNFKKAKPRTKQTK